MIKEEIKKRIESLVAQINEADYNYHQLDNPIISDYEYDMLLKELRELEEIYPEYKLADSPTSKIGSSVSSSFKKVKHLIPMMSLSNQFSIDELSKFCGDITNKLGKIDFIFEEKLDGLAISIEYRMGKLYQAITRGDGTVGEDVTNNILLIKKIPHNLKSNFNLQVRGEIFMNYSDFEEINNSRASQGLDLFANPRNATAGIIRQIAKNNDKDITRINSLAILNCNLYTLINYEDFGLTTQEEVLSFLTKEGLPTNPHYLVRNELDLNNIINTFNDYKKDNNYPTDGVVIKVNDIKKAISLGYTAKFPKGQTAFKFKPNFALTKLEEITCQVGRTGVVTPVANFTPILLDGSTIKRATLHNFLYIKEKDIREGDYIYIYKAGEIIPKVDRVELSKRTPNLSKYTPITKCPVCDTKLLTSDTGTITYCPNKHCMAKIKNILTYFASRPAMNIMGLGEKIVSTLVDNDLLTNIISIYTLKNKVQEIKQLRSFDDLKINNLLREIEESKNKPFKNIITALGIKNVGAKTSDIITRYFKNIDNLMKASIDELALINEVGPEIARSIYEYFQNEDNLLLINFFKNNGFNLEITKNANNTLAGYYFLISGTLDKYDRDQIKDDILNNGGQYSASLTKATTHLLIGNNPSNGKVEKAKAKNVVIITEEEYENLKNGQ